MELLAVPVKAELTEIEEFLIDNILDYGIIAGGFAAYLYNPEKPAADIDLFVNDHVDGDSYDRLYHDLAARMSFCKKMKWRLSAEHPKRSMYNENVGLQGLNLYDYTKIGKHGHHAAVQMITLMNKGDTRHATTESILESFDWNVCRAVVLNKSTLLVDKTFIRDMEANRVTFRPYPPRKTMTDDYGWRLLKYIEHKEYDMPFGDMLTVFGLVKDKKKFYEQIWASGHAIKNRNLIALGNYITLMMNHYPDWKQEGGF